MNFKLLFFTIIYLFQAINLSHECKRKITAAASINSLVFDPDDNVTLPNDQNIRHITCEGDCDKDAYKLIQCKGVNTLSSSGYDCELIDSIPNYILEDYQLTCVENFPIKSKVSTFEK